MWPHGHLQVWQKEALMCGDISPEDGGEELSGIDVGGGEGGRGRELADDGQNGDYHGLG